MSSRHRWWLGGLGAAPLALAFALVAIIPATPALAQAPAGMVDMAHASQTGVFRTMIPNYYGPVDSFSMDQPSPVGNIHATGYQVASDYLTPNMMALQHLQAPPGYEQGRTDEQVIWDTLTGMVGGMGGTVIAQRPVTLGGYPGLEADFVATFEGISLAGRVRVFKVGNEAVGVFFVSTTAPGADNTAILTNPVGTAFLESLSYTPTTP